MSRNPYRSSANDVDRHEYDYAHVDIERDRHGERLRFDTTARVRERSPIGDRDYGRGGSGGGRTFEDERIVHERRVYEDDNDSLILPASARRRRPPPAVIPYDEDNDSLVSDRRYGDDDDYERRVTVECDKVRVREPSPPPPRPGRLIRRQSSLDTFDRRPARRAYDYDHVDDDDDRRPLPSGPIPLPQRRRRDSSVERISTEIDEIRIEPSRYERPLAPPVEHEHERIRETEVVRTRREGARSHSRSRSRESRLSRGRPSRPAPSPSLDDDDSDDSTHGSVQDARKDQYPKKGKTRIPARLVSERALIDLRYPFIKEGNVIVVQLALGQDNIDDVLRLSRNYKKTETDIVDSKTTTIKTPGATIVEKETRREEVFMTPAVHHVPPPAPVVPTFVTSPTPPPEPVMATYATPADYTTTVQIRDVSPTRSYTTATTSTALTTMQARSRQPAIIVDSGSPAVEISEDVAVGPLALVAVDNRHRHHRSRSSHSSMGGDGALYARIHDRHHHHHHHYDGGHRYYESRDYYDRPGREVVRAERLGTGEIVVYEEQIERIEEPRHGVRIEKDKKGRMAISVPKYHY